MKIKMTVKKNMLSKKFDEVSTGNLVLGIAAAINIPSIFIDKEDKTNLAGQIIEAEKDGVAIPVNELNMYMKTPHTLKFAGTGTLPGTVFVEFEEIELVSGNTGSVDIDGEIDRIVNAGICGREEIKQRIKVMKDNKCSDALIYKVLAQTKEYDTPVRFPSTIYQNADGNVKTTTLKKCLMEALSRHSIIYEGDKSVGKNVCAETVAWLLGMPYYIIGFSKKTTMGEISGEKTTEASRLSQMSAEELVALQKSNPDLASAIIAKGQTISLVTEEGELVRWMRNGGLMMFNEVNMADSNLLQSFLNPLADGTGFVVLPGHGRVELNPDCVLVGSQNPGYTGTQGQNAATLSRLGKIYFPYPKSVKAQLKAATLSLGIADEVYEQTDKLYGRLHAAVTNGNNPITDGVLNIRGFVRALETFAAYPDEYRLADAIKTHVVAWAKEGERRDICTIVDEIINC